MRTAEICRRLDKANEYRAKVGYPPGYPVILMTQRPGVRWSTLWSCKRRINLHEEAAARLLADGLTR